MMGTLEDEMDKSKELMVLKRAVKKAVKKRLSQIEKPAKKKAA